MRVLVIFSWDDDISQARHERMKQERRLEAYDFHQRFALPSDRSTPEEQALFATMSRAIEEVKPDVLLIHTGAAYDASPGAFAGCMLRIRKAHPGLRLGLERRHPDSPVLDRLGIFEQSAEMRSIEEDFFH